MLIPIFIAGLAIGSASATSWDQDDLARAPEANRPACCDGHGAGIALLQTGVSSVHAIHQESVIGSSGSLALEESEANRVPETEKIPLVIGAKVLNTKIGALLSQASLANASKGDVNGLLMEISDLSQRLLQPSMQTTINITDQRQHEGFQEDTPHRHAAGQS